MALSKFWLIIFMFSGFMNAQNLFFTDSYQSNLYQHQENKFIFNNNIFAIIDEAGKAEVIALMNEYFETLDMDVQTASSFNDTQIAFSYSSNAADPLIWSKTWHNKYESRLLKILKEFLTRYYNNEVAYPKTIKDAAIKKHAYYNIKNFKERVSDYTATNLNISLRNVNIETFLEDHVAPNLSLYRIVTNSVNNFYNEAYPIEDLDQEKIFILGPNSKARLKDCFSMHLYTRINELDDPIYLVHHSLIVLDSLNQNVALTNSLIDKHATTILNEMTNLCNDLSQSFYNIHDKSVLLKLIDSYTISDYEKFVEFYFEQNSINEAKPIEKIELTYNKAILSSEIEFKENSIQFLSNNDSLLLNSLALFLNNNSLENLVIIGFASADEYTRIDKIKYLDLVNKYKEYTPVKSSTKPDLSIYRAVTIFDYLVQKGVNPKVLICMSKVFKSPQEKHAYASFALK